jgi:hypothetical protein
MINKNDAETSKQSGNSDRKPSLPRIQEALNAAAQDAVELHRQRGLPLVVWLDGKTALVSAADIEPMTEPSKRRRKS